ncbi:MAG: ATP synthase F1 subunit gamma [Deltaproteobacteria bacterium]|nr:ATP synthase F1 subunit gamma [Deltaproteobacteria bacterium]MBW2179206.1 ATP synthase F1 subunit gamma [Deltaproteobacteria bacterium]MBW2365861.1 ATP synthase F1 subunit gamma [Deltaproteobacteria bacterium]
MATLKEVKTKIGAVKKTKQITRAMNMVATSRLRGAQTMMDNFRPYAAKFAEVLGSLAEKSGGETANPLIVPREEVRKIHIVLCTSDRGLCAGFNVNLIEKAESFVDEKTGEDIEISFTNFGKRGRDRCRKNGFNIENEHIGVVGTHIGFNVASQSGQQLVEGYLDGTYDEVYVIYAEFVSMARQTPTIKQLLPIPAITTSDEEPDADTPYMAEHICEPSAEELLGHLLPRSVHVQLYSALLETSTSEHAARMTAMDNASKACDDMLEDLTLIYNKARQAAITAELMDIVGGAEALKG